MYKLNFCLWLFMIQHLCKCEAVNYNPYNSRSLSQSTVPQTDAEHHQLHAISPVPYNNAAISYPSLYYQQQQQQHKVAIEPQQNVQSTLNYQQFYPYNDVPFEQSYQPYRSQTNQPTQSWTGPPIVVDDEDDKYLSSNTRPSTSYNKPPSYTLATMHRDSKSPPSYTLATMHRDSKSLPVYNQQQMFASHSTQLNYDNNNVVYHRDFRQQINNPPESKGDQQNIRSYYQQQRYGPPQQTYASNNDLHYDSLPSDYFASVKKANEINYRDYFKRYLENNPRRIKPVY